MKEGFGTRQLTEPTEFCDVLNTIRAVPQSLRPAKVNELEAFIAKIDSRKCMRMTDTYCSFFDLDEFTKKPDITSWLWALKYNIGDMIADLAHMNEKVCNDPKPNIIIDQLKQFKEEIKQLDLTEEQIKEINAQMRKEWKREWIEENAWDYDEEELKTLKTPFDGDQK